MELPKYNDLTTLEVSFTLPGNCFHFLGIVKADWLLWVLAQSKGWGRRGKGYQTSDKENAHMTFAYSSLEKTDYLAIPIKRKPEM